MEARNSRLPKLGVAEYLGLALLCACSGCWEKIEYTGPGPETANRQKSPPPAVSVASEEPPIAQSDAGSAAVSPTPGSDAAASGDSPGEMPPAVVEPPPAETSEAVGGRYASASEPVTPPPVESATASEDAPPPDNSATAPSDPPASAAPDTAQPPSTRRAAWELGSKLSIVALANDRGVTANVPTWARQASAAAKLLGVELAKLPDRPTAGDANELASKQVLNYLFVQGQELGRSLAKRHGPDHAALFEVAVKSNLLLLLYQPDSSTAETISGAISQAAPRAKLPNELWQPLVDQLKNQATLTDVRAGVQRFHADVDQFLAQTAEQ